jgi:hypothetical protein
MTRGVQIIVGVGVGALIAAIFAVGAVGFGGTDPATPAAAELPPATDTVTRTTLIQTEDVVGTLGYGTAATIDGRSKGIVTWMPTPGSVIKRGRPVYRADDVPVPLWYGALPLYRALHPGVSPGPDVAEVERNLAALGYTGFTADDTFTDSTAAAVRRWQGDLGLKETGTVDPASVVVAADAIRVATDVAAVGAAATGPILTATSTTRRVTIALDVAKEALVHPGVTATIALPDGTDVSGKVTAVGTVATAATDTHPATIDVTVSIAKQSALGTLDQASVDVTLVSAKAANVLTVPVEALLALADGGYGVQVVSGHASEYVAVELGLFGGGRVQISGPGITDGTVVGVPHE